jgi:Carboxypeptidase regulatory-like domain
MGLHHGLPDGAALARRRVHDGQPGVHVRRDQLPVHHGRLLLQLNAPISSDARRRWITAALIALSMLVVPFVAWIVVPAPAAPPPPHVVAPRVEATAPRPAPATTAAPQPPQPKAGVARPAAQAQEGGVEGQVQDPQGAPVAGASVTCGMGDHDFDAQSDETGRFRLGLEAAGCKAVARKEGFAPSDETELRAGSNNTLRLSAPTGIAGNVVDETGAPVMSYMLGVASFEPASGGKDGGAPPAFKAEIDDVEGAFERTDLAPGRYVLAVSVRLGPMARSQSVEVKPGAVTRGVRVVVHAGVTVVGTVTDATTHRPVDGAMVYALLGGMKTRTSLTRGGEFTVEGAPAEGFELHVFHGQYAEHVSRGLAGPAGGGPLRVDVALEKRTTDP